MIKYLRLVLFPFSIVYGLVVWLRNRLYDRGFFSSYAFDTPVICVGNMVVGGAGKTPVTEYLVRLFAAKKTAILSRGYGRNTSGYRVADENETALTLGDEPMQYHRKFPEVTVAVNEDRVLGIHYLKSKHDLIILDDAFQHRRVRAGLNILLFDYKSLLYPQFLLPAGNLREPFSGYKRADLILITKCPEQISDLNRARCLSKFDDQDKQAVFFSGIEYESLKAVFPAKRQEVIHLDEGYKVYLLTGIANPKPIYEKIHSLSPNIKHYNYPDHHTYKRWEIRGFVSDFNGDAASKKIIITTEKDAQRLLEEPINKLLQNLPVFYWPIRVKLQERDLLSFESKIIEYVSNHTGNR